MTQSACYLILCAVWTGVACAAPVFWGETNSRNLVSQETHLPAEFDPKTGHNIAWSIPLGTETHSTPIIAGGRIYIGTNNGQPRDPKHDGDRGVFMCFDEKTQSLLWQLVVPKRDEDPYQDWPKTGISSPATVEGNRVYLVSNRHEVMCLDARGQANGNDGPFVDEVRHQTPLPLAPLPLGPLDADILWSFDMKSQAGIWPHDGSHTSVLIDGPFIYVNTGTGVDSTHKVIRGPDAPSLLVFEKLTGRLIAREREGIAPNIFHSTWSSPSLITINGQKLIFFAGGNGIIYAFEAVKKSGASGEVQTLKKVWQFDFDPEGPKEAVHRFNTNRREGPSNIYGMPVLHNNHLYVAGGGDIFWGKNAAWLKCVDLTGFGKIPPTKAKWSYPLEKHVMSTPVIVDGLSFISDCGRKMHCVDAETGTPYWTQDIQSEVWASPLVADGKVYLGTRSGQFWVFAATREKKVLNQVEFGEPISATVTAANQTLYIATMSKLFAIKSGASIKR